MNNTPFTYFPMPYPPSQGQNQNIIEEIKKIKQDMNNLKERIEKLENKNQKNYLQNDSDLYMI